MVQEAAVVIPYYHNDLDITERISYEQCIKVLRDYPIVFVIPKGFEIVLDKFPEKWEIVEMPPEWMVSIEAYNQMMLSREFYMAFQQYKYILIYQLDAYVFSDRLLEFCEYGYDYIGAPWIEGKFDFELADRGILYVGNGGFSLRKVNSCLHQLNETDPKQIKWNEDLFWASRGQEFKVAPKEIAWQFAFERPVRVLYRLNGEQLPFGCHAWMKYDLDFFRPYIAEDGHPEVQTLTVDFDWDQTNEYIDQRYLLASKKLIRKSILETCKINPRSIWIYGAGKYGSLCGYLLHGLDNYEITFRDRDESKWGKHIWGAPVMKPGELEHQDKTLVIVAMSHAEAVTKEFIDRGYACGIDLINFKALIETINRNMQKLSL